MEMGPDGRRHVDLTRLPSWARLVLAVAIVLVVSGIALWLGRPTGSPLGPIAAVVAGVIAFGVVAWRSQHPR